MSREDPYYSMGQGPDPLGRHSDSRMSWGWTLRRWLSPWTVTVSCRVLNGSRVQMGLGPQTHLAPALVGLGAVSRVLGPHPCVAGSYTVSRGKQARGPFPSRSRFLFNLGVVTTLCFSLKWFSRVTFNYSKTLPHTDHIPKYVSN